MLTKEKSYLIQELKMMKIKDKKVLKAIESIPREEFIPPELIPFAYKNSPLAIGKEQTISQPYIVALMTELLEIVPDAKVLELGTGSGYQAAVLAFLGAHVTSIERIHPLHLKASQILKKLGFDVNCVYQDGFNCNDLNCIYDRIIVTAALDSIDDLPPIEKCLNKENGILVIPIGGENEIQRLFQIIYHNGIRKIKPSIYCRFVPLKKGLREE